ncbi:uncharacterized protein LOC120350680 isoform X1 [Nilaparvata lugens]|uniref:uncharacterized protein LOC120350680 isoform X1 n=1 Tax=Nilaparvata lugens TaxID=108931 RepID=UPI00193D6D21|nr:uncharacterized protein LOC120350680 isoform X1 [Nilaparvata lugens]
MRVGSEGAVKDFLFTPNDKPRKLINISPAGMNLRIGSTWHKKFEGGLARTTNEYICRREYGLDFPHIFTPECSVKHNLTNSDKSIYAKVTAEDFPRMFTVANREVWLCKNNHDPIYRVVNLVIGRVPIKSIEPEDDIILIHSINITNGVSVIFKEVGFFKFYLLERHDFETPYILKEDDTVRESKLGNSLFWDGRYKLPRMGIYKNIINAKGYDLRIGSKTSGPLSTNVNNLKSSCEERDHSHQDFLTKLRLKMMVDDVVQSNKLIEDIDESQHFFNYKNKRVWKCKEKTTEKTFWMIVNVMEVLVAVRVVETFDGVELVQKPASNGTLKLLDIHETKFLDENYNPVIYLGQLEYKNNEGIDEVYQKRQSDGEVLRKSLDEIAHRLGGRATQHCYTNLRDINVIYRESHDVLPKQLDKIVGDGDSLLKFELHVTIDDKSVKTETTPGFALE